MYALSELAQHIIKARAQSHSWTLQSYPKKVKLYPDILRPLPNSDAVNEVRHMIKLDSTLLISATLRRY